ncbi:hypothetical protein KSP39_PZI005354 [Platanthera zijinensis]|uniref:Eukaryotic translation initiation factor 4B2 n=1 Tax=Platanthera zijinensis TaxID=2320716 RepID=A0AAP0GAZ9_9ASPA
MKENKMLPWSAVGAAGAWALDAERAEAEEAERAAAAVSSAAHSSLFAGDPVQSFPTPKEAAAKTTAKKKKKKGVAIPLSVFTTNTFVGPGDARRDPYFETRDIAADQMLFLPTRPRERPPGELENTRIGGGFRSYDSGAPRRFDEEVGWGLPPSRARDPAMPSRADEVDSWASVKKPYGPTMDSGRNAASSRAGEVGNWSSEKKFSAPLSRQSGYVSGFRAGSGMDSDRWGRGVGSVSSNVVRERPKLVLHPPKKVAESLPEPPRSRPNPFSAARPREVVLAEKGLDWKKMEIEIEMKKTAMMPTGSQSSRASTSGQSSRPASPASQLSGQAEKSKPRPKVNPFGGAKPREVLLEEKGMDWRKIDRELEHRRIESHIRPERDEEKMLKVEIDHLKKELGKITEGNANDDSAAQHDNLPEQIRKREQELEELIREFDDKVRFGHKSGARPGSGSSIAPSNDPSVRSGFSERSSRQTEFADRNRSRGTGGSWGRFSRGSGVLECRRMDSFNKE